MEQNLKIVIAIVVILSVFLASVFFVAIFDRAFCSNESNQNTISLLCNTMLLVWYGIPLAMIIGVFFLPFYLLDKYQRSKSSNDK